MKKPVTLTTPVRFAVSSLIVLSYISYYSLILCYLHSGKGAQSLPERDVHCLRIFQLEFGVAQIDRRLDGAIQNINFNYKIKILSKIWITKWIFESHNIDDLLVIRRVLDNHLILLIYILVKHQIKYSVYSYAPNHI